MNRKASEDPFFNLFFGGGSLQPSLTEGIGRENLEPEIDIPSESDGENFRLNSGDDESSEDEDSTYHLDQTDFDDEEFNLCLPSTSAGRKKRNKRINTSEKEEDSIYHSGDIDCSLCAPSTSAGRKNQKRKKRTDTNNDLDYEPTNSNAGNNNRRKRNVQRKMMKTDLSAPSTSAGPKKRNPRNKKPKDENLVDESLWIRYEDASEEMLAGRPTMPEFNMEPGAKVNTEDWELMDYFLQFFPMTVFEKIVQETNRYADQYFAKYPSCKKWLKNWKDIDTDELMVFLGLEITTGLVRKPAIGDYWETSHLTQTSKIAEVMSRERFAQIRKFLHFNNNENMIKEYEEGYDPLFKVRPLIDLVMHTYLAISRHSVY